jgi:hypothetical protein
MPSATHATIVALAQLVVACDARWVLTFEDEFDVLNLTTWNVADNVCRGLT